MSYITAEEIELLTFFEVEPKARHTNGPWPYNDFLYEVQQGDIALTFSIDPAYKDLRLAMRFRTQTTYELIATGIEDIKYHNDSGRETLEVLITPTDRLLLRIKPRIEINHISSSGSA